MDTDMIIISGIMLVIGIVVFVAVFTTLQSEPTVYRISEDEANTEIKRLIDGYNECSRLYGVIGEELNRCQRAVIP